jgi:hypothetical protein
MSLDLDAMLRTADDAACERDSETFAGAYADDVRALIARVREMERVQAGLVDALESFGERAAQAVERYFDEVYSIGEGGPLAAAIRRAARDFAAAQPTPPPEPLVIRGRDCTCNGPCRGADGLAPGWRCARGER